MADIEMVIKLPESIWVAIQNEEYSGILDDRTYNAIKNGIPHETVTEFADRCRECGKMRKGHWISIDSKNFEFHRVYKCSECGSTEIEYPKDIYRHFRYCPNCGAKMESEE